MRSRKTSPIGSVFGDMGKYWAEIADADATEKQIALVKSVFSAVGGLVLDLGCGTGRHAVPLCRAGYGVVGLDLSRNLLRLAKSSSTAAGVCCMFVRADMRFLPFQPNVFAGVMSLDTSFGYSPSEAGDLHTLLEARRVLSGDGHLLIDVFNSNRMLQRYGRGFSYGLEVQLWLYLMRFIARFPKLGHLIANLFRWYEYPDFYLLQKRTANAKSGELQDLWLVRDKQDEQMAVFVHIVRLYDLPQLQNMFEKVGFHTKNVYGNYKEEYYTKTSRRLIVIAQ